ncbi:MAG: hypothetical protein AAF458_04910 [Pseudomonadota bacterium]
MSGGTYWLLTPSGQRADGGYVDDTLVSRADERGLLGRLHRAGKFPRQRVEVVRNVADEQTINETYYRRGWTDGLPVVAPTLERIEPLLQTVRAGRAEVLAELDPLRGQASVEKVAANAVMAGCEPEHFPVLLNAVRAIAAPEFNLRGVQTTDENVTPVLIYSGPNAAALEINDSFGALGPGWRGGAAIGRALRLVMQNIGGGWPAAVSLAGLAQPARIGLCFAEREDGNPWNALRVDEGFAPDDDTLTVMRAETVINVTGGLTELASVIGSSASAFSMAYGGEVAVVLSPYTARQLDARGFSKADVQRWLHAHGRMPQAVFEEQWLKREIVAAGRWPDWLTAVPTGSPLPVVERPENIRVIVSGGDLPIAQQAYLPTWGFPPCWLTRRIEF